MIYRSSVLVFFNLFIYWSNFFGDINVELLGINGGMSLREGKDASGRKAKVLLISTVLINSITNTKES